jgi:hypothetical protein
MDVGVDQAEQHQPAAKVDHLRRTSDQGRHVLINANRDDGIALDGDGLLDRALFVGRVDLAVAQNDVRIAVFNGVRRGKPERGEP